jgi:hypothetical protein
MPKQQQIQNETILVNDPETEQLIDIKPLFDLFAYYQENDTERNLKHVKESTDDLLMMVAKGTHNDILEAEPDRFRSNMQFMERLHIAFNSMTVFKKHIS